jgi:hypothetical protein
LVWVGAVRQLSAAKCDEQKLLIAVGAAFCDTVRMDLGFASGRDLLLNRILFASMILIVGLFWFTRQPPPPVATVNGRYSNPCCQPILIKDGLFVVGAARVPFTLRDMKFGLEATPTRNITVDRDEVQVAATDDAHRIYILFDDDHHGFTLLGPSRREIHFRR